MGGGFWISWLTPTVESVGWRVYGPPVTCNAKPNDHVLMLWPAYIIAAAAQLSCSFGEIPLDFFQAKPRLLHNVREPGLRKARLPTNAHSGS